MKKFIVLATALSGLLALVDSASAADMAIAPAHDWTGPYIGVQGGYGWGDTEPTYSTGGPAESADVNYDGFVGGIEAGYNWQSGSLVLGVEADSSLASIDGYEVDALVAQRPCIIIGQGCSADVDWFATGRLRVGYAMDTVMPYITGGVALGGVKGTFDSPGNACTCDVDDTTFGWTVGGGIEWAIDDRWSVKAEYLYVDLGKPSIDGNNTLATPGVGTDNYDFSVARLGVNFGF